MIRKITAITWHAVANAVRRHRWLPGLTCMACFAGTATSVARDAPRLLTYAGIIVVLLAAFVWGYSVRTLRFEKFPPLTHLQRRQYPEVWNSLANSLSGSYAAVAGQHDEKGLRNSCLPTVKNLLQLAAISRQDDVLEIGCGIGRIGHELAAHCRTWTGADISSNMLTYAAERLRRMNNIKLVHLSGLGLPEFVDWSFDIVYMTNMLMHLDQMDRWKYVEEAFRVLRPTGRIFFDNVDLESDTGWNMFANDAKRYQSWARPPYMPSYSTAAELMGYAKRAGFVRVSAHQLPPLVVVTAWRSDHGAIDSEESVHESNQTDMGLGAVKR